jgi:pimeloyl-ACP methyl ester carboxylesterase
MPPIAVVGRSVLLVLLAVEQLGPTLRIAGAQDPLWTPARRRPPAALGARATAATAPAGHLPPLAAPAEVTRLLLDLWQSG